MSGIVFICTRGIGASFILAVFNNKLKKTKAVVIECPFYRREFCVQKLLSY